MCKNARVHYETWKARYNASKFNIGIGDAVISDYFPRTIAV